MAPIRLGSTLFWLRFSNKEGAEIHGDHGGFLSD